ncbi:MAG TPA: hypothetical protein VNM67_18100 [Thermoanaerobaculia bacterium]|jgi:hypothetical protein|nr:hypothetical protein [Thermoanaerobaculia bacterium]
MSLFDYPRINIQGTFKMNPGTANNDDYAGYASLPSTGETLALIDSKLVEPRTYGMSDADFIAWAQKAQTFNVQGGGQRQIIPAEWNYYGGMSSKMVSATVVGVQTGPGEVYDAPDASIPVTGLMGANLGLSGHFTDVNSEGSPPATQFFIDSLTLTGSQPWLSGDASKGACQWLNFYRNVNLTADAGAGGYVYHVMRKKPGTTIAIPGFDDPGIAGIIFRYYLYASAQGTTINAEIEAIYQQQGTNPAVLQLVGTIAPLFEDETIFTTPTGRLMVSNTAQIPTPTTHNNGNGMIALAPAVLSVKGNLISADFSGTFPENYQSATQNQKFDFGPVSLVVTNGTASATIAQVDYSDTDAGNERGWVFDYDISSNTEAQTILASGDAVFKLVSSAHGDVLVETDYYFVTNQQAIYTEQLGSGTEFVNQGTTEPATVAVFHRGKELSADACPPITVWQYRSIPLQAPGNAEAIITNFKPGQPLSVDTSQPGNFLFTFTVEGDAPPPASYSTFMNPPYITNTPQISLRILPNNEDFSQYYVDPTAKEPVGNSSLTFDVVYQKVLRTYYLLYPAMNKIFALNSESAVAPQAENILKATDPALWMSIHYMPRTRDMSASRRQLLQAWCRAVIAAGSGSS